MCVKCVRRVPRGLINHLAHCVEDSSHAVSVPLFGHASANAAVEARIFQIRRAKTARRYHRRER